MNTIERDEFIHALGQTLAFYGKDLDKMQTSFWVTACRDYTVSQLKRALLEYVKRGKYAPKPADILEIVAERSTRRAERELPAPPKTSCPEDVARAWMWFINRISEGSAMAGLFQDEAKVDVQTQERYLHIVNHEAHKYGTPEAIPDEFKLAEVWG